MQILTLNINQGPKPADLEDRLYPAIRLQISVAEEAPFGQIFDTDLDPLDAQAAARGEAGGAVDAAAMQAAERLYLDPRILPWLIAQIVAVLRVILPRAREDRVLRAVEDLWGLNGRHLGQIRIETPVWRHVLGARGSVVDEKRFCSSLMTDHFDRSDAQVFLLTPDDSPMIDCGLAYSIRSADAHAEGAFWPAMRHEGIYHHGPRLRGDLGRFIPQLRTAADAVDRMARLTKKIVRLYDVIRDADGVCQATYAMEAPYYKPDHRAFPMDAWLDHIFNPEAKELA